MEFMREGRCESIGGNILMLKLIGIDNLLIKYLMNIDEVFIMCYVFI